MRIYRGWINLVLAALAMTATLPGRTHGLGLITVSLTTDNDLKIGESEFADLNFWAVIVGSALCIPVGRLIDRFGVRGQLVGVAVGLGFAVLGMSLARNVLLLFVMLTLVRGLGQGALSVVSLAMIGKWFTHRLPTAMAIFTVLIAFGFILGNFAVAIPVDYFGWRPVWAGIAVFLLVVLAPLGGLLARDTPESMGVAVDDEAEPILLPHAPTSTNITLLNALLSPAFWAYTFAASLFNLIWSAITLFNQSIFKDAGFGRDDYELMMGVLVLSGVLANFAGGWLSTRWPMGRVLLIGMTMLAGSLAYFPLVVPTFYAGLVLYTIALGFAGGIVTVVFFAFYGHAFGRTYLGSIQAAAQVVTVFASALGPVLLKRSLGWSGSNALFFCVTAVLSLVLGIWTWRVSMPQR